MSTEEQIARLETRMDKDDEDRAARREELDKRLERIEKSMNEMTYEINRYKGFVGGVALVISVAWAGVALFKEQIAKGLRAIIG